MSVLGRMLSARKAAVLRSINRDITAEETVIATTQRELDKINRILHPIMYNNRLRTISTAAESLDQYRRIRDEVEANEDYFGKLQSIADNINRLNALLSLSKQDIDRPSSELMYKARVTLRVCTKCKLHLLGN